MIYYEISDLYQENIDSASLLLKLKSINYIKFFAFVLHNRTLDVKPHYHVLVSVDLDSKIAKKTLSKDLEDIKGFVKYIRASEKRFARYMTHIDYPDKEHYSLDEIVSNDMQFFESLYNIECVKSDMEKVLQDFFLWIEGKSFEGIEINDYDIFKWFLSKNKANYYISHRKNIIDIVESFFKYGDYIYNELERRNKINDCCNNNNSNYTIDNLI